MVDESIKKCMSTDLASVEEEDNLQKVVDNMAKKDRDFVVVRRGDEIKGIISDDELFTCISQGKDLKKIKAGKFMNACQLIGVNPCLHVSEDETVENAIKTMSITGARYLLVTGEKGVTGVVSAHDLICALRTPR